MAAVTENSVDVVLPCLNEAEALPWVLARIPAGWRALVVDNGSTDGSADIARSLGATVVRESRRGFGAACHAGLLASEAEYVCFCDCDAGWRVREEDVPYLPRSGKSKVTGTWRGTWHAVRDMRAVLAEPPYVPAAPGRAERAGGAR
ncbi:glycosyltransferase family 2 protein [Streptomyces sp. NPDC059233]